jgi:hypothetical protein
VSRGQVKGCVAVVGSSSCAFVVVGLLQCGSCLCCGVVGSVIGVFSLILLQSLTKEIKYRSFFFVCELFKNKLDVVAGGGGGAVNVQAVL